MALTLLVGICFTACTNFEDDVYAEKNLLENNAYIKLSVTLPTETSTRAAGNPTGGEEGDGRENGVRHENELKNVTIFIIRSLSGFDAPATTNFLYKGYIQKGDAGWTDQTYGVDILFPTGSYVPQDDDRVIVVANAGNLTSSVSDLGSLRDYNTTYSSWRNGASLADNDFFVMSSAYNSGSEVGKVVVSAHAGTKTDPYLSTLHIQRTAARIDFMYKVTDNFTGTAPTSELFYEVKNSTGSDKVATVHLDHIIPFNLMQESSYLIRRVTSSADVASAVNHGAKETVDGSGIPTNYVIEPHTRAKQSTVDALTLGTWYGSTRAKAIFDDLIAKPTSSSYLTSTGINSYVATHTGASPLEMGYFSHYMTLAYTNENTQSKEKHSPDFMTGLLLKTVYEPKTVYSSYAAGVLTPAGSYAKGTTFYRYTPTKASMVEEDSKYFTTEAAATAYKTAHPEDLAEIVEYENGVCYYNIWLRHANVDSNPHTTFPMEYGIVRNNIYRVGVEKFTGPGTPTPSYEGPEHVRLRIFVRPWNLRVQPEIRL